MKTIRFSQNWTNKLDNKVFFTTLRLDKGFYKVGENLNIELTGKVIGIAKVQTITSCDIEKLPDIICFPDTGYDATETRNILKRMYPNENWLKTKIAIILLKWTKKG